MSTAIALEDLDWPADARAAIEAACRHGGTITAETLREAGLREPPRPSMWGPAFKTAQHDGLIQHTGWRPATRRARRGAPLSTWRPKRHLPV